MKRARIPHMQIGAVISKRPREVPSVNLLYTHQGEAFGQHTHQMVASHEIHARGTNVAGDVILGCLRQTPSPEGSRGNKVGTPIAPIFLNTT